MSGKGSKQRPTDQQKFSDGWELVFGRKMVETLTGRKLTEEEKQMSDEGVNFIAGKNHETN